MSGLAIRVLACVCLTTAAGAIAAAPDRAIAAVAQETPIRPGESCAGSARSDLYCVRLYPTAAGGSAAGILEMRPAATLFGVAVTAEGHHIYTLSARLRGLPEAPSTDPYNTYVAWATTPFLDPIVKLGEVRNGQNELGHVSFNKFLILVTAEPASDVEERSDRLMLRGRSPSSLMEGHDLLLQAPSALRPRPAPRGEPGGHAADPKGDSSEWAMPPMYPDVPTLPGMIGLTPSVRPWLPEVESLDALPLVRPRQLIALADGGTLDLQAGLVRRRLKDQELVMFAFNGQQPGPLIRVPEQSTIFVNFTNNLPLPTAIHWHGVRLDNRFDGAPGVTQDPVHPGGSFRYQVYFRDAGIYWYHPHLREDIQQEMGLYGNMLVDAPRRDYFGPVNREEVLMLDDILLYEDGVVQFGEGAANFALMGRFGNVFLVNGEPGYELELRRGDVVRFFLTNVSSTRTFNLAFVSKLDGLTLPIKVVGSDIGKFEREQLSGSMVIAPAERYVVEVMFDRTGEYFLANRVQAIDHRKGTFFSEESTLGGFRVAEAPTEQDHSGGFAMLRENADVIADIDRYRAEFDRPLDQELSLTVQVDGLPLALEQVMAIERIYFNPVEWSGTMPMMNWLTTGGEVRWILRDVATGRENADIDWRFEQGRVVKIRLRNERDAFHSMQHPLHIHGQRFLVLERDGVPNTNLVWKDTVLLPAGSSTDILLELSNPGRWMVHCHIAEHLSAGMSFVMEVEGSENGEF